MSGKCYSMKEQKAVTDYIVNNAAYSEVKGRKMWIEFSNSKMTNRTWQSLKETFLKRILPDITNPYYKLTQPQICSFRQGYDVTKLNNKLVIQSISDESSNTEDKKIISKTKKNDSAKKSSLPTNDRASVETLILDVAENKQDNSSDLTSKNEDNFTEGKSLKDLIIYSEPLTPMLQEVLHDFSTDDEGDLIIDTENLLPSGDEHSIRRPDELINETNNSKMSLTENDVLSQSEELSKTSSKNKDNEKKKTSVDSPKKLQSECQVSNTENVKVNTRSQNIPNSTDSLLPNNQEELLVSPKNKLKSKSTDKEKSFDQNKNKTMNNKSKNLSKKDKSSKNKSQKDNMETENIPENDINSIITKQTANKVFDVCENNKIIDVDKITEDCSLSTDKTANITKNIDNLIKDCSVPNDKPVITNMNNEINLSSSSVDSQLQSQNPCLKSVSLFAERFSENKYDSDTSIEMNLVKSKKCSQIVNNAVINPRDVVVLKSHSETDEVTKEQNIPSYRKVQNNKALASIFGYSKEGANRKRKAGHHKLRSTMLDSSSASEWLSDSEDEFVSPPRGRRNRLSKRYLKPKSARVFSLEEEGGLFVMHGKKIFPVIKDGKLLKKYVTYLPDSNSEEDESYWRSKYEEEKKKSSELKKLILERTARQSTVASHSNVQDTNSRRIPSVPEKPVLNIETSSGDEFVNVEKKVDTNQEKTVKIKLCKNNEEIQVEGHWSQIHPMFDQVVSFFNNNTKNDIPNIELGSSKESSRQISISSGVETPVLPLDKETHAKVDKIEKAIFKVIEEQGKTDNELDASNFSSNDVVEKKRKRGRPPITNKTPLLSVNREEERDHKNEAKKRGRPPKTNKTPLLSVNREEELDHKNEANTEQRMSLEGEITTEQSTDKITLRRTKRTRHQLSMTPVPKSPVKQSKVNAINETITETKAGTEALEVTSDTTKSKKSRKSMSKILETEDTTESKQVPIKTLNAEKKSKLEVLVPEDSDVKYRFPSPILGNSSAKVTKEQENTLVKTKQQFNSIFSPNDSRNSESTQGYLDSSVDVKFKSLKKKRKLSSSTIFYRQKQEYNRQCKRRSSFSQVEEWYSSSESSNSSFNIKIHMKSNSSSNTEVYRSESYQLLMPRKNKIIYGSLDKIVENDCGESKLTDEYKSANGEIECSSNLSIPMSPELSIVENISMDKIDLTGENKEVCNVENNNTKKYTISKMDVSMPLMAQNCRLMKSYQKKSLEDTDIESNQSAHDSGLPEIMESNPLISMSESLLLKVGDVKLEDIGTVSLNDDLQNLVLESGKKKLKSSNQKKSTSPKTRRRSSSTPRKRTSQKNSKLPAIEPVIEEEHMESCSFRRKSGTLLNTQAYDGKENQSNNNNSKVKSKGKTKKDVIKVKILRPKRSLKNKNSTASDDHCDSGKHESGSGMLLTDLNDSVELIHNHSDTCLHAHERIDIDEISKTIDGDTKPTQFHSFSSEFYCTNAQDGSKNSLEIVDNFITNNKIENTSPTTTTMYCTPPSQTSFNSLVTEDLSDEVPTPESAVLPKSKWYLLSEDESSNTNFTAVPSAGAGSNLKQIFPIVYAVPDLSTITEQSDDSRKANPRFH